MTLHAAARMIFLKPMTTHVTYLIKTFQWLSISLKIQAKVLTNAYKSEHDLLALWLPSRDSPLEHPTPGSLASSLVFNHIGHTAALTYLHVFFPLSGPSSPSKNEMHLILHTQKSLRWSFFEITFSLPFQKFPLLKNVPIGYFGGLIMKNCYIQSSVNFNSLLDSRKEFNWNLASPFFEFLTELQRFGQRDWNCTYLPNTSTI